MAGLCNNAELSASLAGNLADSSDQSGVSNIRLTDITDINEESPAEKSRII
jgi:hypothetical protein